MVRSRSRTSRQSVIKASPAFTADKLFNEIQDSKWNDMLKEEMRDMFILQVRDEIVEKCLKICYERYMERQAVAFTVRCSYLAWLKVINVYNMPRDAGDDDAESWIPDKEPEPSAIDSWATRTMTTSPDLLHPKESQLSYEATMTSESYKTDSIKSVPSMYFPEHGEYGEEEYEIFGEYPGESLELFLPRKRSIFTRTLSMPRELLPLFGPLNLGLSQCKDEVASVKKRMQEDVIRPTFIDVSTVQQNRGRAVRAIWHR